MSSLAAKAYPAPSVKEVDALALDADATFFANNPGRNYRIRKATQTEVQIVQVREHRLLEPSEREAAITLVQRTSKGDRGYRRRRVVIEAYSFNTETQGEAAIAALFKDITEGGWVAIEGGQS